MESEMSAFDDEMKAVLRDGQLPCAVAFDEGQKRELTAAQMGEWADANDVRISHCQLGLFGYGPKSEGKHKIVRPAATIKDDLAAALRAHARDGRIPCADVWAVAAAAGIARLDASAAAEALGLRVRPCQLGCF
jgi:hypothetical protein